MYNSEEMIAGVRKSIREGGANMRGMAVLILHTIGRKTGKPRVNPVMYMEDDENYVVTASNNGGDKHPAWFLNL